MAKSDLSVDRIDADQVREETSAMAEHLQRSGVNWIPRPQSDAVASLAEMFAPAPIESLRAAQNESITGAGEQSGDGDIQSSSARSVQTTTRVRPVASTLLDQESYPEPETPQDERHARLHIVQQEVESCTRCEILSKCRNTTVFGEGSVSPRVVFFGEGPGADEDRTGRPFVGRAGQLLTKMIEACTFQREDVYILNTVKCRPPGNRNPEAEEIENCREYYQRQLSILRPEYIVCLGAVSAQELLQSKLSVGRLRGKLHAYFESKVLVTYHPAYLLRNPAAKKAAWDDLQLMLRDAGIEV